MTATGSTKKPLRSWRWLLPCAALPLLGYLLSGLLGGRDHVEILTGTQPQSGMEILLGFFYILSFFGLTMLSPIFVLAAGLLAIRDFLLRKGPAVDGTA